MYNEHGERVHWDKVALVALTLIGIGIAVWWLQSNFGALVAIMSLGLVAGALFFVAGSAFNQRNTKIVLGYAADFLEESTVNNKQQYGVVREYAKMERDAFNHRAKLDVLDEQRVMKLASQHAKLLAQPTNDQRNRWEIPEHEDEYFDDDGFNFVE